MLLYLNTQITNSFETKASDFVNGHVLYVDGGILATIGKPSNED